MKRDARREATQKLIYALNDGGVQYRNKWRSIVWLAVWLVLSGMTMVPMILAAQYNAIQIGVAINKLLILLVIGLSLIKYLPLLTVVYNLARKKAALYLDDIFELHDEELASHFLEEVTFGGAHEKITIKEGRIPEKDERSPLVLIGGPGLVQVNLDSVALLEQVDGTPEVIYPRSKPWKLGMFERIREIGREDEVGKREYAIINLRDQFISGLSIKSRTKDGIPIEAQDIKVIFSILRRQNAETEDVQGDAYLFEPQAVASLVYGQTLITPEPTNPSGIGFPWDTTVIPLIHRELEDLITSRTLSEILATIGQKEVDETANNDQTIARMSVEVTGQTYTGKKKQVDAPKFHSRSRITAQFYEQAFKEKAASLGVSIEWIDIGTWKLPNNIIPDKHKEAWDMARSNAIRKANIEKTKKQQELKEILNLVDRVIIMNYEKAGMIRKLSDKEISLLRQKHPGLTEEFIQLEYYRNETTNIANEMLRAFRKELVAAKDQINKENKAEIEKENELASIEIALMNINHIIDHWVGGRK